LAFCCPAVRSDEEIPAKVQSLIERIQKTQERDLERLQEDVDEKESALRTKDRRRTKEQTKKLAADAKAAKDKLDKARKGETVILPQLNLLSAKVGAIGLVPTDFMLAVSQVIDGDTLLVIPSVDEEYLVPGEAVLRTRSKSGEPLLIRGFPTAGLVDGKEFHTSKAIEVVGTESYTTVLGAKKTVFVIKPFDLEKWLPTIKKELRPAAGKKGR
jgi:hypothetical protein